MVVVGAEVMVVEEAGVELVEADGVLALVVVDVASSEPQAATRRVVAKARNPRRIRGEGSSMA
jgi:hypothetical protein